MIADSHPGYLDRFKDGIEKIKEGFSQIEQEQKKLKSLTVNATEACKHFGISNPTLVKRRNANLIPYIRFGNQFRYFITAEKGEVCSSK
jgi:hypothetical protein